LINATSRLLIVIAILGVAVFAPNASSAAELACSARVLSDWSDNGRIDRVYALPCYEEAIATLPTDIRDYTNANNIIDRAMMTAVRGGSGAPPADAQTVGIGSADPSDSFTATPVPLPLLVLLGLALVLLAAGTLNRVARRSTLGRKGSPR
jgi:hypothetical protein